MIVDRPPIHLDLIPFGPTRIAQTRAYAERHYGLHTALLKHPKVIVIHYTETTTYAAAHNTFVSDAPDPELHETPGTCAHFIIDTDGTIYEQNRLKWMCRHTVGLNDTAIGIEHVGSSDRQVLDDARQMASSLKLVRWLQARFHIKTRNVIGHNESLSSPYHHERVARLRRQTHADFKHADMQIYRRRLRAAG